MKILNYRSGFAANSSSTHSTWLVKNSNRFTDDWCGEMFNWDNFTLKSKESKMLYIIGQVLENINYNHINEDIIINYLESALEVNLKELLNEEDEDTVITPEYLFEKCGVDHQSVWKIPPYWGDSSGLPSIKLVREIRDYIMRDDIVIFGGNDNTYYDEEEWEKIQNINMISDKRAKPIENIKEAYDYNYCKKDGNCWIYFNNETGDKLKFTFGEGENNEKSETPELVDLLISYRCNVGCDYCYLNCTEDAKYADISVISSYIKALVDIGTLEIAIGGGDIVDYPDLDGLVNTIENIKEKNPIVVNTTVKYISAINNIEKMEKLTKVMNSIAISAKCTSEIHNIVMHLESIFKRNKCKLYIQFIPELSHIDIIDLSKLCCLLLIDFNFLGLKETGRALKLPQYQKDLVADFRKNSEWIELLKKEKSINRIGVDTQFLKNFPKFKEQLPSWMYTEKEGTHSCCVDAVNGTVMRSSYSDEIYKLETHQKYINTGIYLHPELLGEEIKKHFKKF